MSRQVAGAHLGTCDSNLTRKPNGSRWSLGAEMSLARISWRVSPPQAPR